ncbi:hypothetical protein BH09VER1_BH09VER1_43420 [soil metagenome]
MKDTLFSYVVYEASSLVYLLTNLLITAVAAMTYLQTQRKSLLLLAIGSACSVVTGAAFWIVRHWLASHHSYSLIMGSLGIIDMLNALVCTAALVWFIRTVCDALPPPLPK